MDTAMQFRHSCCFVFCCSQIFFCSNFKKTSKVYPLQQNYFYYFSSECFLDTRIAILATPPKQIAKLQTFSHSEFQTGRRKFIVSKKILSLRMIHVTHGMQYWRHVGNFWWFQIFTGSNFENEKKTVKGKKNKLSSKSSSGLVENSFDDPAHIFSAKIAKVRSFVCQVPKSFKKVNKYFNNTKSHKWFIWTCKSILWQTFHSSSGNSELLHSKRKLFE